MRIDPDKCTSCLECIDICTMHCILEKDDGVRIDEDECVECGVCLRTDICPTEAIYMPKESMEYPRIIRAQFSDPGVAYPKLNQGGRGTEEMKTNDVTGRYRRGEFGMALEFGRPGIGTRISEIEKVLKALIFMDVDIEKNNPVFFLLEDEKTGTMKPETRGEKILSAILEFKIRDESLEDTVKALLPVLEQVDTVVSWGLATRFERDGSLPVRSRLKNIGISVRPNAKINMGMGRPIIEA